MIAQSFAYCILSNLLMFSIGWSTIWLIFILPVNFIEMCLYVCLMYRFTSDVKLKSISIVGGADGTSPAKMRAWVLITFCVFILIWYG